MIPPMTEAMWIALGLVGQAERAVEHARKRAGHALFVVAAGVHDGADLLFDLAHKLRGTS